MIATNDLEEVAIDLAEQSSSKRIDERLKQALVEQRLSDKSNPTVELDTILDVFNGGNPVFKEVYGVEIDLYETPTTRGIPGIPAYQDLNKTILSKLKEKHNVSERNMALIYFLFSKTQMLVKRPVDAGILSEYEDLEINQLDDCYIETVMKAVTHHASLRHSDTFGKKLNEEYNYAQSKTRKTVGDYLAQLYELSKLIDKVMTSNACVYLDNKCFLIFNSVISKGIRKELY